MAAYPNKYSFQYVHILTAFCIKTNLSENRFFLRQGGPLVTRKGTQNVKKHTEKLTELQVDEQWVIGVT